MKRLAVYCGSATPADPRYVQLAADVGTALAKQGIGVVYGGGRLGLMGAVAGAALMAGGEVLGVIPEALVGGNGRGGEVANYDCELTIVADMHERKAAFTRLSDGFLVLPGGVGTMDELWEAVSWSQLGYHNKPVGLLDVGGFYSGLRQFIDNVVDEGFLQPRHRAMLIVEKDPETMIDRIINYTPPENEHWLGARDV